MSTSTFRTAVVRNPGGPDAIEILDLPVVEPGPGEVRVEIAAAAVNPVDLAVADGVGLIDQPERTGLGWDFAGIVVAAGPGVDLSVGTRVAGLVDGFDRDFGTYAELLVVPATDLAVVPDGLDLVTASTLPLNGLAAAQILDLLGDAPGDGNWLLVTGAAGAVGGYVAALAPRRGWQVTGLARSEDEQFVRGLGADFIAHLEPAGTRSPTAPRCRSGVSPWSATAGHSSRSASAQAREQASRQAWISDVVGPDAPGRQDHRRDVRGGPGTVSANSGRYRTGVSRSRSPRSTCWRTSVVVRTLVTEPKRNPVSSSIGAPVATFAVPCEDDPLARLADTSDEPGTLPASQ